MKTRIYAYIIFFIFLISAIYADQETGVVEGQVIDQATKQELPGATIEVMGTNTIVVTDIKGNFKVIGLKPRTYNLKISAVYYVGTYKTDVLVTGSQSTKLTIELKLASYKTDEVVVTPTQLFDKSDNMNVSANSLSPEEIRRAPGAVEDLNRMIQTLPGVATTTDSRNDLIVRGGSPIENLILIDGIEVPNINHFPTQGASGGPIGMVNVDFLNDVNFSAGGFSAKYGDRLSSVMDVQYRDGDKNKLAGKFDLGIAGAGLILEGPIQKGKSSFLFSARKSYLDLILSSTGLTAVPNYSNFNLKATYNLSPEHKLDIIGLAGIDKINFKGLGNEDDPYIDSRNYYGWQGVLGITHKWLMGKNTFLQTSLSTDQYKRKANRDSVGTLKEDNNDLDAEYLLRSVFTNRFTTADILEGGMTFRFLHSYNKIFRAAQKDVYGQLHDEINISNIDNAFKYGAFVQFTKYFFERLSVTAGFRYDYFNYIDDKSVYSPRLSASYNLLSNLKLNTAYGIYYQAPPLIWLISYGQNKKLKQIKNRQVVVGFEYYPIPSLKMTLEYFDKKYSDYPASIINPEVSYGNVGADYATMGLEPLVSASNGYARGIEFFMQKKLTNKLYGMFNYSFSRIRFTSLDGIERPSSFDYRNIVTLTLGYKLNSHLEISGKYRYMGGHPYTPLDLNLSSLYDETIYDNSLYNSERSAPYRRMDIRVDYTFELNGWSVITFIDFQNILNIENVDQYIWNEKKQIPDKTLQWKFLPAGGVKVEF